MQTYRRRAARVLVRIIAAVVVTVVCPIAVRSAPPRREPPTEKPIRTIGIVVNGEPLTTDAPARAIAGRLFVPLRDVFAALGITVVRSGSEITARLPTGNVNFRVDSHIALVSGRRVELEAPVRSIDGTVFTPLGLLVAAFGATTTYDQRGANVQIVSADLGRTSVAEQQRAGGGSDVQGVVSALDANSLPTTVTVVRGGTSRTIAIASDTRIWSEDVTIHSQYRAAFPDLHVGDAVHAILDRDGRVLAVFDFYKSTSGKIAAISSSAFVLLNGRVVTPGQATDIAINGAPAHIGDLRVGDVVTVRSNPESGELRQIVVSRPLEMAVATAQPGTPSPTRIDSVTLSTSRPLRAGGHVDITLRGSPHGVATFDIGDLVAGLKMSETTPGTYVAHFTVPDRFNVTQIPVYGELTVGTSSAPRTQADGTLSAATTPPTFGDVAPPPGQTVNNVRPGIYATFITPTDIGIDTSSIALEVNGHDVTSAAVRTANFITYSPGVDLPNGPISVAVRVTDAAGNTSTKAWTFVIAK